MEESLEESLNRIRAHKENFGKQQLIALECTNQFQNGMHLPLAMTVEQQPQLISWISNNDNEHMIASKDSNLLHLRDVECSAVVSFPSYYGYCSGKPTEIDNSGQESGALNELSRTECSRLQLGGQYPCPTHGLNFLTDEKFKPEEELNLLQPPPMDFQVSDSFELSRPSYETHGSWASTSGHRHM